MAGVLAATMLAGCGGSSTETTPARVEPSAVAVAPAVPSLPDADALTETATLRRVSAMRTRPDGPPLAGLGPCAAATTVRIAQRRDTLVRVLFRSEDVDLFAWLPQSDLEAEAPPARSAPSPHGADRAVSAGTRLYDEVGTLVGRVRRDTHLDVGAGGQLTVPTPCGPVPVRALGFARP